MVGSLSQTFGVGDLLVDFLPETVERQIHGGAGSHGLRFPTLLLSPFHSFLHVTPGGEEVDNLQSARVFPVETAFPEDGVILALEDVLRATHLPHVVTLPVEQKLEGLLQRHAA